MADEVRNVVAAVAAIVAVRAAREIRRKKKRWDNRRWWTRPWIMRRGNDGNDAHSMLFNELRVEDPESYRNFLRMNETSFTKLLTMVEPMIAKKNTNMRECISSSRRLVLTLRFLATGESYRSLTFSFRIPTSTIASIIPEVCDAIYKSLKDTYMKVPTTPEEWEDVSWGFSNTWNFPNCLGALDGKHVEFRPTKSMGSYYHNYKGGNSIVLLALVDATYKILFFDLGCNGRVSDGGVFRNSILSDAISENLFNFPEPSCLPGTSTALPYVIVADAAFPLKRNIMKPYGDRQLTDMKKVLNYRLSRARRTSENAFGILANRFRVLLKKMELPVEKVIIVSRAACALHNFLIAECSSMYTANSEGRDCAGGGHARPTEDLRGLERNHGNRPTNESQDVRQSFTRYFNTSGAVPWQWEAIQKFNY